MSLFGKLLNVVTIPVRAVVTPLKATSDLLEGDDFIDTMEDTVRYTLTGKQKSYDNPTDGFCDFDDDDWDD